MNCLAQKIIVALSLTLVSGVSGAVIDAVNFGDPASESAHALTAAASRTESGGAGEVCRLIEPPANDYFESKPIEFTLKIDPVKINYLTVKLWGGEVNDNLLYLYIDGKQLGYRHLGDYDILDHGANAPQFAGRFVYLTTVLPLELTRGKSEVKVAIYASGPVWGYAKDFKHYQKPMTTPSRGIYTMYSHTDGFLAVTPKRGAVKPVAGQPAAADFSALKDRVNRTLKGLLESKKPLNQMQLQFLARAYFVKWSAAWHNPAVIRAVLSGTDDYCKTWIPNPDLTTGDRSTWNPDWYAFAGLGEATVRLWPELESKLDEPLTVDGQNMPRRAAWAKLFALGVNYLSTHRRMYTNQSMIIDMNLQWNNRALALLAPEAALPAEITLGFLKESVGLLPWSGSLDKNGKATWPAGKDYYVLTPKFMTRELGYVGSYGEVLDWVGSIYDSTRPTADQAGDPEILAAYQKIFRARSYFRYPLLTADGRTALVLETAVGWRDTKLPGDIIYGQRASRDASPFKTAVDTNDPLAVGLAKQQIADGQFFPALEHAMTENTLRTTIGLLNTPDHYDAITAMADPKISAPMSPGAPDFVFADETDGVVAVKDGDEILYASLYWRARHGVNFLAKVHYLTPEIERIATVREEIIFADSGMKYPRKNWINFGFGDGGAKLRYPNEKVLKSAHTGEVLPIAQIPAEIKFKPGDESPYAGRGLFYRLDYGPFVVAMNASTDREFTFRLPDNGKTYRLLPAKEFFRGNQILSVKPGSTLVLRQLEP